MLVRSERASTGTIVGFVRAIGGRNGGHIPELTGRLTKGIERLRAIVRKCARLACFKSLFDSVDDVANRVISVGHRRSTFVDDPVVDFRLR